VEAQKDWSGEGRVQKFLKRKETGFPGDANFGEGKGLGKGRTGRKLFCWMIGMSQQEEKILRVRGGIETYGACVKEKKVLTGHPVDGGVR